MFSVLGMLIFYYVFNVVMCLEVICVVLDEVLLFFGFEMLLGVVDVLVEFNLSYVGDFLEVVVNLF